MAQINTGRVVLGGLAAGLVMNVVDFLVNNLWLGSRWEAQTEMFHPGLAEKAGDLPMIGFIVLDFVLGLVLVWLYAAIRPRFGPGPKTALIASIALFIAVGGAFTSYWFMAFYTWKLVAAASAGGLVSMVAAGYVGGMLYQEEGA